MDDTTGGVWIVKIKIILTFALMLLVFSLLSACTQSAQKTAVAAEGGDVVHSVKGIVEDLEPAVEIDAEGSEDVLAEGLVLDDTDLTGLEESLDLDLNLEDDLNGIDELLDLDFEI